MARSFRHQALIDAPVGDVCGEYRGVEQLEELKEAQFRCTVSGSYARFHLTPAQDETFVEVEVGMDPAAWRWKVAERFFGLQFKRWAFAVLDALPGAVRHRMGGAVSR